MNKNFRRQLYGDWESSLKQVDTYIRKLESDNMRLTDRLQEYNKDDEIAKLKAEIDELKRSSFIRLSKEERERRDKAWKDHAEKCTGRTLYYRVYPTGIGDVIYLCCDKCNMKVVISDDL